MAPVTVSKYFRIVSTEEIEQEEGDTDPPRVRHTGREVADHLGTRLRRPPEYITRDVLKSNALAHGTIVKQAITTNEVFTVNPTS